MDNVVETYVERAKWLARMVSKRRWLGLGVATGAAVACGLGIGVVPNRYEATARVYVDTQTVLKPLMDGLTYQPDINQQVSMLARTLISRPNVERLVALPELELDVSSVAGREQVVSRLMADIKVAPAGPGNLYQISYRGPSPERAQRLVEATVEMFVRAGATGKKRDSQDAGHFIEAQIRSYETKLTEAENRLKDFKIRNFGVSGVSDQDYFTRVSVLSEEVDKLRVELAAAERSRDAFRRELAGEDPQLPTQQAARYVSAALAELEQRLEAQNKQLDDLLRRYTDAHPDVTSTRRVIEQLQAEVREQRAADERAQGKGGIAARAATSPVYQQLRISLAETEARVASLRSQLAAKQAQLAQVRSLAGRVPHVEAELVQLNRDYDIIRKNYDLMVARRESASLGVKLDESSQLAEFRVVEPPRVSPSPVFPARLHLASIAVVLSLSLGVAAAILVDLTRPSFDDAAALRQFSDRPVIGTVSPLVTPQRQQAQRRETRRFAASFAMLLVLQGLWLAWLAATNAAGN